MADRPADIALPDGWTWERVEEARSHHGVPDNMVPVTVVHGVVAWITINAARQDNAFKAIAEALAEPDPGQQGDCPGHEWSYTGTQYGGDDESYHGEGRVFCIHCGADGDA